MNEIKNRDVSDIIKKKFQGHSLGILFKNNNNKKKSVLILEIMYCSLKRYVLELKEQNGVISGKKSYLNTCCNSWPRANLRCGHSYDKQ